MQNENDVDKCKHDKIFSNEKDVGKLSIIYFLS